MEGIYVFYKCPTFFGLFVLLTSVSVPVNEIGLNTLFFVLLGKAAEWTPEELEHTAEAVGYGAVK